MKGVSQEQSVIKKFPLEAGTHFVKVTIPPDMGEQDPAADFASFVANTNFENLPLEAVEHTKKAILDTLACMLVGSGLEATRKAYNVIVKWGGEPQSRILVYGDKVPAPAAAFAMGVMARAADLGPVNIFGVHVDEYVIPSALSVAYWQREMSGKEFITAEVIGAEVNDRIGAGCMLTPYGLLSGKTQFNDVWGPLCAVAKLLNFDVTTARNAIGIAYSSLGSGDYQASSEGNLMKAMQHGFACQDAITCALLAREGVTGTRQVFSGARGFVATQYPFYNDISLMTEGLGKDWLALKTNTKVYACCGLIHPSIDGALDLVREHNIEPGNIAAITIRANPAAAGTIEPREVKWNPQTMPQGQFSLPYTVATAVMKDRVSLDDFTPEEFARKDVHNLMQKIKIEAYDEAILPDQAKVSIKVKDGTTYKIDAKARIGSWETPATFEQIVDKFMSCASQTVKPIPMTNIERVIDIATNLEQVDNIGQIVDLLVGK